MAYVTFGDMQQVLIDHINNGGKPMDYPDASLAAIERGIVHEETPHFPDDQRNAIPDDAAFERLLPLIPLGVVGRPPVWPGKNWGAEDIRVFQHLYNPDSQDHVFKRFVVYYAYKGEFDLKFQSKYYRMQPGNLVIVAPGCRVIAYMPRDSIVLGLNIDSQTFERVFTAWMTQSNVVSTFLHSVLYSGNPVNYLLFHTDSGDEILRNCMKLLMLQNLSNDRFTEATKKHMLGTLLMHLVRVYYANVSYYHSEQQVSLPAVLNYIQNNWRDISLGGLADKFGYNTSYLSSMIRKTTGKTFTALIQEMRMQEAQERLRRTDETISDIAFSLGLNSP